MNPRLTRLRDDLAATLSEMPGVFSTPQWGGRAYKVPTSSPSKPKLLAHVTTPKSGDAISVSFKLEPPRAQEAVDRHEWLEPHGFRTLAPSGWLTATITTKRKLGPLSRMLAESRTKLPAAVEPEPEEKAARSRGSTATSDTARHIDRVMRDARVDGWSPDRDDGWD